MDWFDFKAIESGEATKRKQREYEKKEMEKKMKHEE